MCSAIAAHEVPQKHRINVWRGGRSVRELSTLTGLSSNYIKRALTGAFIPRLDKLKVLARALGMSVHDLAVHLEITDPPALLPRQGFYNKIFVEDVNRSEVSRKTGLTISYISRILSTDEKQKRQPRADDLAILAKYFRCSMDHLIKCWKL